MVNVNILNNLIKGIAEQIPLVNSYYTQSPYESWNIKEVQYGSVSFVVTKVNTRESNTTYDATIYYADRLLEDNSNRDSLFSDAATVIQTIVGALNTADEYLEVGYPVGITLFEQDFSDKLAGGYAQISISTTGMGECFEDDWSVPQIIATSAYYTKDEITELFPLRTQLSTVAYSGSFRDLLDVPELVTNIEYNQWQESVSSELEVINEGLSGKVNDSYFSEWVKNVENELSDKVGTQQYNELAADIQSVENQLDDKVSTQALAQFAEGQNTINVNFAVELRNKVSSTYFNETLDALNVAIEDKATKESVNTLAQTLDSTAKTLTDVVNSKVDKSEFGSFQSTVSGKFDQLPDFSKMQNDIQGVKNELVEKASKAELNTLSETVKTTANKLTKEINTKADNNEFQTFKAATDAKLSEMVTQAQFNSMYEAVETVTTNLAGELKHKANNEEFQTFKAATNSALAETVTQAQYNELYEAVETVTTELAVQIEKKVDDSYFSTWQAGIEAEVDSKVDRQAFDNFAVNVYKKDEIEDRLSNYEYYLNQYLESEEFIDRVNDLTQPLIIEFTEEYLETALDYYTKEEMDEKLSNLSLDDYYNKTEIDDKLSNIRLDDYYDKEEVDEIIDNLELDNYYTKTETYNKEEIDTAIANVDLSEYYTKTEVDNKFANYYTRTQIYSKTEVDSMIGNINTILNNVLYKY